MFYGAMYLKKNRYYAKVVQIASIWDGYIDRSILQIFPDETRSVSFSEARDGWDCGGGSCGGTQGVVMGGVMVRRPRGFKSEKGGGGLILNDNNGGRPKEGVGMHPIQEICPGITRPLYATGHSESMHWLANSVASVGLR